MSGQMAVLNILLARKDILANWRSNNGYDAVIVCRTTRGRRKCQGTTANQFIIVNTFDKQKYTPLLWAVEAGNLVVVR